MLTQDQTNLLEILSLVMSSANEADEKGYDLPELQWAAQLIADTITEQPTQVAQ